MSKTPLLGITEGDPAGIGPEITVQAIHNMADDDPSSQSYTAIQPSSLGRAPSPD